MPQQKDHEGHVMTTEIQTRPPRSIPGRREAALPRPGAVHVSRPRRSRALLPALLTGGLLWLCYFPVGWSWLAWVALVPLLSLVRTDAPRWRIYLSAWASGLVFFWPALQWLRVADDRMYYTWGALATYCSFYFPLAIALVRVFERRTALPLAVSVPVVWTALEIMRAQLMTGFPWYFLSHTQHAFLPLIQISDIGGAYAVTFLVAAVNALLFNWLCRSAVFRHWLGLPNAAVREGPSLVAQTLALVLLLATVLGYGVWRLGQDDFAPGPRIALVQSNLDQQIRLQGAQDGESSAAKLMLWHNAELTDWAVRQKPLPALIAWPETSYPDDWTEAPETAPDKWRHLAHVSKIRGQEVAERWRTNVLLGLNADAVTESGERSHYNSAVLIGDNGRQTGRYDKMHRVPFGEYVPLVDAFPWMHRFAPYDYEYSVAIGKEFTRFPLEGSRFGVVICYEDTDPDLARQYVNGNGGPSVDFLLNISNDGWFNGTSEHEEHLAICRFRAIECRRAVARAVNMGVSAVIDSNGRVLKPEAVEEQKEAHPGWAPRDGQPQQAPTKTLWVIPENKPEALPTAEWAGFKKRAGLVIATMPIDHRASFYAQWGDWLPWACWVLIGVAVIRSWARPVEC
jgi:apolipoprotein N-acyltransferase